MVAFKDNSSAIRGFKVRPGALQGLSRWDYWVCCARVRECSWRRDRGVNGRGGGRKLGRGVLHAVPLQLLWPFTSPCAPAAPSLAQVNPLLPVKPGNPSPLAPQPRDWDLLLTAETHNFPCAVAPFPGAETGAGGRMRDTHATGTGSIMGAGTAGYCTGNLRMDGYVQPWEDTNFVYPGGFDC